MESLNLITDGGQYNLNSRGEKGQMIERPTESETGTT